MSAAHGGTANKTRTYIRRLLAACSALELLQYLQVALKTNTPLSFTRLLFSYLPIGQLSPQSQKPASTAVHSLFVISHLSLMLSVYSVL